MSEFRCFFHSNLYFVILKIGHLFVFYLAISSDRVHGPVDGIRQQCGAGGPDPRVPRRAHVDGAAPRAGVAPAGPERDPDLRVRAVAQ
jgi:hypothetical protein